MNFDDDIPEDSIEIGSDELLSDDNLRLPENASNLVRLHAIRAWLTRMQKEATQTIGETALVLQQQEDPQENRMRRSERLQQATRLQHVQQALQDAQQSLHAYEEAEALLEDCVAHTTSGERVLVEYYLMLEDLIQNTEQTYDAGHSPWLQAIEGVQHRVEHVGAPNED